MISDAAGVVLFAIRSSIRLGGQLRQAYIDSTRRRELVLPLPNFFSQIDVVSAANYFAGKGRDHASETPRLAGLLKKRQTPGQVLTPEEEREICDYHLEFENLDRARAGKLGDAADGASLEASEFSALITIRQWQRGADPNPSTLQRIAGSLVEIGVDYFQGVPTALTRDSREGRAVAGFLDALSEIQFSDVQLGQLPGRLFVAALETISEHGDLLTADAKVQELVKAATKSLSADVARRLDQLGNADLVKAERVTDWAELVFRSVLSSAGGLVLSNPARYLGVEPSGQAALVGRVGESILSLVLDGPDLRLDRVFSRQSVEKITRSALAVVGAHPEILIRSNHVGLQKLLSAVASELGRFETPWTPDLLPELTRLILDKTGENLPLLWPDLAGDPQKHLLLAATSTALDVLTRKPAAGEKWTPEFSSADLVAVAETVLEELAANPAWLLDEAGRINGNLQSTLAGTLGVLRARADLRLSTSTAAQILREVVMKAGWRKEFLEPMPGGTPPLVVAALDTIFRIIFNERLDQHASWQVVRAETVLALVRLSLEQLAKAAMSPEQVVAFNGFFQQQMNSLAAGGALDLGLFAANLEKALTEA